jgi:serine protease Do
MLREGKRQNFKVVVGDLAQIFPERFGSGNAAGQSQQQGTAVSFGMSIQTLTERQRETMKLEPKGGVQIVDVDPNSFAEDIGLLKNDVIVSINNKPVTSTEDVKKLQSTLKPGDAVAFHIMRRGNGPNANWISQYLAGTLR